MTTLIEEWRIYREQSAHPDDDQSDEDVAAERQVFFCGALAMLKLFIGKDAVGARDRLDRATAELKAYFASLPGDDPT